MPTPDDVVVGAPAPAVVDVVDDDVVGAFDDASVLGVPCASRPSSASA